MVTSGYLLLPGHKPVSAGQTAACQAQGLGAGGRLLWEAVFLPWSGTAGPSQGSSHGGQKQSPRNHIFPPRMALTMGPNPQYLKLATQPGLPGLLLPVGMEAGTFPSIWAALHTSNHYGASAVVSTASSSCHRLWIWIAGVKPHRTAYSSHDLRQVTSALCTLLDVLSVK